tara:strand:+ start:409 stop:579 length:171 start_codon:yes stop_codon:yes gene_type:complete
MINVIAINILIVGEVFIRDIAKIKQPLTGTNDVVYNASPNFERPREPNQQHLNRYA